MKRNIISMLLAIALVVGLLPVTALAAESYTYPTSQPTPTWTGSGTAEDPYVIDTAQELADLAWMINNGKTEYKTANYQLGGNIDLSGGTWTPIGGDGWNRTFAGTFDGGSFTVSGLNTVKVVNGMKYVALFGQTDGATVKNLTVSGTFITDGAYAAGICAYAKNTAFISCTSQVNITGTGAVTYYFGGIAGYGDGTMTFTSCTNSGNLSNTGTKTGYIGGICGRITSDGKITYCGNNGGISGKSSSSQGTGGIVGFVDMASGSATTEITGCTNSGAVSGTNNVGGIAGYSKNTGLTISGCVNSGAVTGTNENAGGICGFRKNPITGCTNSGNVTGSKYVGGISGKISGSNDAITLCANSGSIKGTYASTYLNSVYVGGIEGYSYGASGNTGKLIENCYNTGNVVGATDSSDYIGGISGNMSNGEIANCHNYAALSFADENYSGAIAYTKATVTNCYYLNGADENATQKTAEEFADGTVGKLLQAGNTEEVWGQTIGTDLYPVFFNGNNSLLAKPVFAAYASLSLDGTIGVHFFLHIDQEIVEEGTGYMHFAIADRTVDIPVGQATQQTMYGESYYVFTAQVAAKEMADTIRGVFIYDDGNQESDVWEYSVMQYANAVIAQAANNETLAQFMPAAKAMLNYGAAAQILFNYNTDNLANASLSEEDKTLTDVDASAYAHSVTGSEEGIQVDNATLLLETETTARIYFKLIGDKTIDQYTFKVDGTVVQAKVNGELYYVEIPNIAAQHLDEMHTVSVGGLTIVYSGLSYVHQVITEPDHATEEMTNAAKALFAYNRQTEAYFN